MRIGGLEAGGTKMVCAVGNEKGEVLERISIPTLTPDETFPEMISYYKEKKIDALGIGSFGPVDLDKKSLTYGSITKTPKPGWSGINFVKRMQDALEVPVGFDTDVNGAILGEVMLGNLYYSGNWCWCRRVCKRSIGPWACTSGGWPYIITKRQ